MKWNHWGKDTLQLILVLFFAGKEEKRGEQRGRYTKRLRSIQNKKKINSNTGVKTWSPFLEFQEQFELARIYKLPRQEFLPKQIWRHLNSLLLKLYLFEIYSLHRFILSQSLYYNRVELLRIYKSTEDTADTSVL